MFYCFWCCENIFIFLFFGIPPLSPSLTLNCKIESFYFIVVVVVVVVHSQKHTHIKQYRKSNRVVLLSIAALHTSPQSPLWGLLHRILSHKGCCCIAHNHPNHHFRHICIESILTKGVAAPHTTTQNPTPGTSASNTFSL